MSTRRNLFIFLAGLALIVVSLACGLGAAPEAAAPPPAEEPAAPEMTALAEPAAEEPLATFVALPTPSPAPAMTMSAISTSLPNTGWGESEPQPVPAIPEYRRLTLEFPPVMRTGDSIRIRMQLEVDDQGNITPTAIVEGNVVTGEVVEIPNLYETHYVTAEARLDMAGMEVQPPGLISEPLNPGQSVTFYWSVRPQESGKYEGTVWLHLRFKPKDGGAESSMPISIQFLTIEARSFMGLFSGGMARGVGAVGSILGSVLGFPFVDDLVKWLWGKIR